ncbi:RNA polymerase sigma factor [Haloechinothrix salitolerans]|uniref:RNA polymerase sigma factor n=1 Tax=Haloechinothrix salitolerans TaxID=926830 RepID=A0ABW2C4D4_9PSEU
MTRVDLSWPGASRRSSLAPPGAVASNTTSADIWALVTAAQSGDADAFGRVYTLYVDDVYRYILARISDQRLSEDFVSETFIRAYSAIHSVQYQGNTLRAWLITIAKNIVRDFYSSRRRRREVLIDEITDNCIVGESAEVQVFKLDRRETLWRCVNKLTSGQRICIRLRFEFGMSVRETAVMMERSEQAIRQLQHRGVCKLSELLERELAYP